MAVSGQQPPLNVNGWEPIYIQDFDTDAARGKVIDSERYGLTIDAYRSGQTTSPWESGDYATSNIEVAGSRLISYIATVDGRPQVTAIRPKLTAVKPYGVDHGRFSVRLRIPRPLPGYKIAWLLWPDSGQWPEDGEIDFPEQNLAAGNVVHGFVHRQDATDGSDQNTATGDTSAGDGEWHTATIMWKPGGWRTSAVQFVWDGATIGKFTTRIPTGPLHWVLQIEPELHPHYLGRVDGHKTWEMPDPDVAGTIEVDWIVAYKAAT